MARHISAESRIQNLTFSGPWTYLTEKEKNYAYYMSKASWAGALITLHQICYEAPPLFCLFQAFFADKNFEELQANAMSKVPGLTEQEQIYCLRRWLLWKPEQLPLFRSHEIYSRAFTREILGYYELTPQGQRAWLSNTICSLKLY